MSDEAQKLPFFVAFLVFCSLFPAIGVAQPENANGPYLGKPVYEVLEYFRSRDISIAYSTNLVPDKLLVEQEPMSIEPLDIIREVLAAHSLALNKVDGIYLVVRKARGPPSGNPGSLLVIIRNQDLKPFNLPVVISSNPGFPAVDDLGSGLLHYRDVVPGRYTLDISADGYTTEHRTIVVAAGQAASLHLKMKTAQVALETVNVSASRYSLFSNSQFFVDQRAIQDLPSNADDPIRAMQRLPGAAAGGWSAQSHFRGGEENESAIFLNGMQLLDPFHARDFHNTFSSIDVRTISGVEAYTGGFPATYGDRMSGMLILQSSEPEKPRRFELGLSVFNTSFLTSGYNKSGSLDWLFSARRSNLSQILDNKKFGEPDYNDIFTSIGVKLSEDTRLTFNALRARDKILIIAEPLPEEREESTSDTLNEQYWLQLEKNWSNGLNMSAVLSASSLSNDRDALVNDEEQLQAIVLNNRDADITALRFDFNRYFGDSHKLSWGLQARKEKAHYRYQSEAEYGGFYLAYPGVPETIERDISLAPSGYSYAAYISDRWKVTPQLTIDAGLRWDKQTYIGPSNDSQVSPRINMLYTLKPTLDLRLTWGRYHQSQGIQQVQVEDGVEHFFPAQQSDHLIVGVSKRFNDNWSLRAEAYTKHYSDLRPRFENMLDPVPLIAELEPDRIRVAPSSALGRGVELTFEYNRGDTLNWWVTYTLSRITDRIDGVNQLRNWDQLHALQSGLIWHKNQWDIGLTANIHSGWPTTSAELEYDDEGEFVLVFGPRNAERLNTFARFDFRISRSWALTKGQLSAFLEVTNMFDRNNHCCVDFDVENEDDEVPELERSVDSWLGILPAIGILWEF